MEGHDRVRAREGVDRTSVPGIPGMFVGGQVSTDVLHPVLNNSTHPSAPVTRASVQYMLIAP